MQVERDHAMFRLDIIMASYTIIKPVDPNYTQLTCYQGIHKNRFNA